MVSTNELQTSQTSIIAELKKLKCIKKTSNQLAYGTKTDMTFYDIDLSKLSNAQWNQFKEQCQKDGIRMIATDHKDLEHLCQKMNEPVGKYVAQKQLDNNFILYRRDYTDQELKDLQIAHIEADTHGTTIRYYGQDYLASFIAATLPHIYIHWSRELGDEVTYSNWSQNGKFN